MNDLMGAVRVRFDELTRTVVGCKARQHDGGKFWHFRDKYCNSIDRL